MPFQILASNSTEELRCLLDSEEFEFRFDAGLAMPTSSISISDKKQIAMSMAMHFLVYKTKAEMDQLREGLKSLGILDLMHRYPTQMKPLFLATGKPVLSASLVLAMFDVHWSLPGSNRREDEEAVILGWNEYVRDLEGVLFSMVSMM